LLKLQQEEAALKAEVDRMAVAAAQAEHQEKIVESENKVDAWQETLKRQLEERKAWEEKRKAGEATRLRPQVDESILNLINLQVSNDRTPAPPPQQQQPSAPLNISPPPIAPPPSIAPPKTVSSSPVTSLDASGTTTLDSKGHRRKKGKSKGSSHRKRSNDSSPSSTPPLQNSGPRRTASDVNKPRRTSSSPLLEPRRSASDVSAPAPPSLPTGLPPTAPPNVVAAIHDAQRLLVQGEYDDAIAATDRALASSSGPPDGFIAARYKTVARLLQAAQRSETAANGAPVKEAKAAAIRSALRLARLAVALKVGDGGASAKTAARVGEALITLGEPPAPTDNRPFCGATFKALSGSRARQCNFCGQRFSTKVARKDTPCALCQRGTLLNVQIK